MCGTNAPDPQKIPMRAMAILPDNGDPSVRMGLKNRRSLTTSASIFAGRNGALTLPQTTAVAPIGKM